MGEPLRTLRPGDSSPVRAGAAGLVDMEIRKRKYKNVYFGLLLDALKGICGGGLFAFLWPDSRGLGTSRTQEALMVAYCSEPIIPHALGNYAEKRGYPLAPRAERASTVIMMAAPI